MNLMPPRHFGALIDVYLVSPAYGVPLPPCRIAPQLTAHKLCPTGGRLVARRRRERQCTSRRASRFHLAVAIFTNLTSLRTGHSPPGTFIDEKGESAKTDYSRACNRVVLLPLVFPVVPPHTHLAVDPCGVGSLDPCARPFSIGLVAAPC